MSRPRSKPIYKPRPKNLTVIWQYYIHDQYQEYVKTCIKKNVTYGAALHIFERNEKSPSFISFYMFSEDGYEIVHFERHYKGNFYIRHFIPYGEKEFFIKRGFKEYEI